MDVRTGRSFMHTMYWSKVPQKVNVARRARSGDKAGEKAINGGS